MHILIPCKNLDAAKSRLSACLEPAARREFCGQLLVRTLELVAALVPPSQIRIVTSDPAAIEIAMPYRIAQTSDPGGGLNAALDAARSNLLAAVDTDAILILPIDLPFASADAINNVLSSADDIVIAPDESGTGTNLLLLRAASLRRFAFAYGASSFAAHVAAARSLALSTKTVRDWRLAFDIDEPSHYAAWCARSSKLGGSELIGNHVPQDT